MSVLILMLLGIQLGFPVPGTQQDPIQSPPPMAGQTTIHVDATAPAGGDGSSWNQALNDLQAAISLAAPLTQVRVAQGVYRPVAEIIPGDVRSVAFSLKKDVEILGGFAGLAGANPDVRDIEAFETVLSGDLNGDDGPQFSNRDDNSRRVLYLDSPALDQSAILDGCTIYGADSVAGAGNPVPGGALYVEDAGALFRKCRFLESRASLGGGVFLERRTFPVKFMDCIFESNVALYGGGGLYAERDFEIDGCEFRSNSCPVSGGGLEVGRDGSVLVQHSRFVGNGSAYGGGISSVGRVDLVRCEVIGNTASQMGGGFSTNTMSGVFGCSFEGNSAREGGGVAAGYLTVVDSRFIGNTATLHGGGYWSPTGSNSLVNSVFSENTAILGGGFFNDGGSDPVFINCVFVRNHASSGGGGLMSLNGDPYLRNCILWANTAGFFGANLHAGSVSHPDVRFCDIEGGYPGVGNLSQDPLFVDESGGDFHLTYDSPCRNAGTIGLPAIPVTDFEGDPRVVGGIDIGADEFSTHLYAIGTVLPGSMIELRCVAIPGLAPVGFVAGLSFLVPPLSTSVGDLFVGPTYVVSFGHGPIPADGVLRFPVAIPGGAGSGLTVYVQALVGAQLTNVTEITVP